MNKIAYILDEVKHRDTREGRLKTLVKLAGGGVGKVTSTLPNTPATKPVQAETPRAAPSYSPGAETNVYQGSDPNIARRAAGTAQNVQSQYQTETARMNQGQQARFNANYASNPEWYDSSRVQNGQYRSPAMDSTQGEYAQLLNQQATQAPPVTGAQARINTPQQARQYAQEFASTHGNIEQAMRQVPAAYQGMSPERLRSIGQDQWAAVVAGYNAHQQQAAQKPPPVAAPPEPPPVPGTPTPQAVNPTNQLGFSGQVNPYNMGNADAAPPPPTPTGTPTPVGTPTPPDDGGASHIPNQIANDTASEEAARLAVESGGTPTPAVIPGRGEDYYSGWEQHRDALEEAYIRRSRPWFETAGARADRENRARQEARRFWDTSFDAGYSDPSQYYNHLLRRLNPTRNNPSQEGIDAYRRAVGYAPRTRGILEDNLNLGQRDRLLR